MPEVDVEQKTMQVWGVFRETELLGLYEDRLEAHERADKHPGDQFCNPARVVPITLHLRRRQ